MAWQIRGEYFETCSCDYVCPCISSNLAARPTQGWCVVALVQHIDQGQFNDVTLDGLNFVVVARTPEEMGKGNWSVGLIVDERANAEQKDALTAIGSGQAGGPMAALGPLIGNFLGVESRAIKVESSSNRRSVSIPDVLCPGPGSRGDDRRERHRADVFRERRTSCKYKAGSGEEHG